MPDQIIVKQSMFEWVDGFAGFVGDVFAAFKPAGASVWLFRPAWHIVFVADWADLTFSSAAAGQQFSFWQRVKGRVWNPPLRSKFN